MTTAVFSDVHANLQALEAVLADARERGAERFVCLGDVVGYNADPVACIDLLRRMPATTVIQGNHDAMAAGLEPLSRIHPHAEASLRWTRTVLGEERRDWLAGLPLVFDEGPATFVHASLPDPEAWGYVRDTADARRHLEAQTAAVGFIGHSHRPFSWRLEAPGGRQENPGVRLVPGDAWAPEGGRLLVNVGSVGQPRDHDPRAAYVLLHDDASVRLHRVAYDIAAAQTAIRDAGLPEALATRLTP